MVCGVERLMEGYPKSQRVVSCSDCPGFHFCLGIHVVGLAEALGSCWLFPGVLLAEQELEMSGE